MVINGISNFMEYQKQVYKGIEIHFLCIDTKIGWYASINGLKYGNCLGLEKPLCFGKDKVSSSVLKPKDTKEDKQEIYDEMIVVLLDQAKRSIDELLKNDRIAKGKSFAIKEKKKNAEWREVTIQ